MLPCLMVNSSGLLSKVVAMSIASRTMTPKEKAEFEKELKESERAQNLWELGQDGKEMNKLRDLRWEIYCRQTEKEKF